MTRRDLLSAALASTPLAAQPARPASPKPALTSSVMLWTLSGAFDGKLETAARAGLQSVELVDEHVRWTQAQVSEYRRRIRSFGLTWDTIIAQPDWLHRPVSMVDPAHRDAFLADVRTAIEWSKKLEVPQIILMSGNAIEGRTRDQQYASCLEGAKRAGDLAAAANVTLIIEPLNAKVDHKGFFLTTCTEGLRLCRETGNPHVRLLFDVYHEQVETGSILPVLQAAAPHTAVFHIADAPGRHDPGTGSIDYAAVYKAIVKTGFSGYITMEYLPQGDAARSLSRAVDAMRAATV